MNKQYKEKIENSINLLNDVSKEQYKLVVGNPTYGSPHHIFYQNGKVLLSAYSSKELLQILKSIAQYSRVEGR